MSIIQYIKKETVHVKRVKIVVEFKHSIIVNRYFTLSESQGPKELSPEFFFMNTAVTLGTIRIHVIETGWGSGKI